MYPPPRRLIKKYLPSPARIRELRLNRYFGDRIHDRNLWQVRRKPVARAVAIGLFCAYLPMPLEMLVAAFLALICRANLPLSVSLVWISNPFTWLLLYTPPYLLGLLILGEPFIGFQEITLGMMYHQYGALWTGCLIFGTGLALAGYVLAEMVWRIMVENRWNNRKDHRPDSSRKPDSRKDPDL